MNNEAIILLLNPKNYKIVEANRNAIDFYGYPKEELLKKTFYDLSSVPKEILIEIILLPRKSSKTDSYIKQKLANQKTKEVELHTEAIMVSGNSYILANITEVDQKIKENYILSEKAAIFEAVIENLPLLMVVINSDLKVYKINTTFYESFNIDNDLVLSDYSAGDLFRCVVSIKNEKGCGFGPECEECEARNTIKSVIKNKVPAKKVPVFLTLDINGVLIDKYILLTAAPISVNNEDKVIVFFEDITDFKYLEHESRKNKELRTIGRLAGGIAHEFNNMLASISNNLTLAKMKNEQHENALSNLSNIEPVIENAKILSSKLISFSSGGAPVLETTNLINLLSNLLQKSTANIFYNSEIIQLSEIPDLLVDPNQITEMFNNIIKNSIEAMPEGGSITVTLEHLQDYNEVENVNNAVRITIKDNGSGINAKDLESVYDLFFTTKPNANGMGLPIALSIINRHKGSINTTSRINHGTQVEIVLPNLLKN